MENKIRNTLNEIYFGKTRDIVNGLRSVEPLSDANKKQALQVSALVVTRVGQRSLNLIVSFRMKLSVNFTRRTLVRTRLRLDSCDPRLNLHLLRKFILWLNLLIIII